MTFAVLMTSVMDLSNFVANSSKVRLNVCSVHVLTVIQDLMSCHV